MYLDFLKTIAIKIIQVEQKLLKLLNIHANESALVSRLFIVQFFLIAGSSFLFVIANAIFLSVFPIAQLPLVFFITGIWHFRKLHYSSWQWGKPPDVRCIKIINHRQWSRQNFRSCTCNHQQATPENIQCTRDAGTEHTTRDFSKDQQACWAQAKAAAFKIRKQNNCFCFKRNHWVENDPLQRLDTSCCYQNGSRFEKRGITFIFERSELLFVTHS